MQELDLSRGSLKKFGLTMAAVFFALAACIILIRRHSHLALFIISAIFFIAGTMAPSLLQPVYIFWMRFAAALSWVNTRIILVLIYYLIFMPTGLIMRLFGMDPLKKKIDRRQGSYWQKIEVTQAGNYERQF
ncbi:MAG: SxtJ family membrane protein [Candidatus Omnitrophota bacterium]